MRPNCTTHARVTTNPSPPTTADSRTMTAPTPTAARSPLAPNIDTTRTPPTVLRDSRSGSPRGSRSRPCKRKTDRHEEAARVARDPPDGGPVWGVGVTPGCGGGAGASRAALVAGNRRPESGSFGDDRRHPQKEKHVSHH